MCVFVYLVFFNVYFISLVDAKKEKKERREERGSGAVKKQNKETSSQTGGTWKWITGKKQRKELQLEGRVGVGKGVGVNFSLVGYVALERGKQPTVGWMRMTRIK